MKKLFKPGDILLLGLAGAGDIFEEIKDPFGIAAANAKEIYGWVPRRFRRSNFSRMVLNRIKTGEIEKRVKGDDVYLRLTSAGKNRVVRDFPVLNFQNKRWDGKWRVVIFDIKEINKYLRNRLRDKLRELGFGMLQESVWITPHDIGKDMREFLEEKKLGAMVFVLEVENILVGNRDILIRKIWDLSFLEESYLEILNRVDVILSDRTKLDTAYFKKKREERVQKIREKYLQILLIDPCLPKELLPENWAGEKARKAILRLKIMVPNGERGEIYPNVYQKKEF